MTMKRLFVFLLGIMVGVSLAAQERYLNVWSGGEKVYDSPTSGSNSITFSNGNAVFTHNNSRWSAELNSIDSLVFTTTGVKYIYKDTSFCEGGTVDFYGQTIGESGTYTHSVSDDTTLVLHVTVNPVYSDTVIYTAIGSYLWQGTTYTTSGTYTTRLTTTAGCDSNLTLVLTIQESPEEGVVIYTTASICQGSSYSFYDTTVSVAGMYMHKLNADTAIVLTLVVNPTYSDTLFVTSSGSYTWMDSTFAESTIYTVGFKTVENCDSLLTLNLTVATDTLAVDTASAVYITWNGTTTTVVNPFSTQGVAINATGGHVTATSTTDSANITYILSGTCSNGSLTLSSQKASVLQLDNLTLSSPSSPAISVSSEKKTTINLVGTSSLSDGTGSSGKGALQTTDKFSFQGAGTLNVTGLKKHAIQSSGKTTVNSGTINVLSAVKDGMNVDNFVINGGTVSVNNPNGDGIDADQGYIEVAGGALNITCSANDAKGLCCDSTLTVSAGTVKITLSGADSKGMKSDSAMFIAGGSVTIVSTGDTCKGISCNSNLTITGGTVDVTVGGAASKGIKTDGNLTINGGNTTVRANGTVLISNYDPSYCTGLKVDGSLRVISGTLAATCASSNAGGKSISTDGNIIISGGQITLSAPGSCSKYLASSSGTYDSYSSTCLKSNGNIAISGGSVTASAGGRAINADGCYMQTGGNVTTSTSASGFTVVGSGTSCTDGFAPACLKADGQISIIAGTFSGSSTGTGGRGIVGDSTLVVGSAGAADSLLHVCVTTSGAAVNATSSGGFPGGGGGSSDYWKGLPKGVKIEGSIRIFSGSFQSYCSQTSGDPTGEAIETKDSLFISGGYVEANSYDDAINADTYISISGGYIWAYARGNDGMDCNGNRIDISGGTLICRGTEVAVDDNGDQGGRLYISGGTIVLIGGNMGMTEATPSVSNQKSLTLGSSSGSGRPGGGGNNNSNLAANGFTIRNSSNATVMTYKWPSFTGSGFNTNTSSKPGGGPGGGSSSGGVYVSSPAITSGSYTYYTSPTISGGTNWHGLYSGATVTTSGSGVSVTAQ